ncbi:hypothetical protein K1719_036212 [Acacia pycnantha]|nr:hypothetical protein K1719_036212 [Acacia pycnantha]
MEYEALRHTDGGSRVDVLVAEEETLAGDKPESTLPVGQILEVSEDKEDLRRTSIGSGSREKKAGAKKKQSKTQKLIGDKTDREYGRQDLRKEKKTREMVQKEAKRGEAKKGDVLKLTYVKSNASEKDMEVTKKEDNPKEHQVGSSGNVESMEESFNPTLIEPGEQGRLTGLVVRNLRLAWRNSNPEFLILAETKTDDVSLVSHLESLGFDGFAFIPSV